MRDLVETLFLGNNKSSDIVTADKELKTLKHLVNNMQNRAWQFNTVNNLMWAFGRYGDEVLEHTLKLFFAGTFAGYIYKHNLLDKFVKNYDVFAQIVENTILGDSEGKEKAVLIKVLNNYEIKHIVRTIVQFLRSNIKKDEICKFIAINLCNSDIASCDDFCDDVLLLIEKVK